jgi:ABC-type transport system involved in multi-copper enzyme maturation permease subunit
MRDLSDFLSPILVKEVRQGVRGQVFSGSCLLLQVLMLLVMAAALAEQGRSRSSAEMLMVWFWLTLGVPVALIQPLSGIAAVSGEKTLRTLEPMLLTGLSARRIVLGKWTALAVQNSLLVVAAFPFFLLRYFLGGIDLVAEGFWMLGLCVFAGLLTALTVGISPLPVSSLFRILLYLTAIVGAVFMVVPFVAGAMQPMMPSRASPLTVSTALSLVAALLALETGAQQIAAPAERGTTRLRLLVLAVLPLLVWGTSNVERWLQAHVVFWATSLLLLVVIGSLCEAQKSSSRAYAAFFARGPLRALAGVLFAPGWASGVFFTVTLAAGAGLATPLILSRYEQFGAGLALTAGLLLPVLLMQLPFLRGRRRGPTYVAIQLLTAALGALSPLCGLLDFRGAEWLSGHALLASPLLYLVARLADAKLPSAGLFAFVHLLVILVTLVLAARQLLDAARSSRPPAS